MMAPDNNEINKKLDDVIELLKKIRGTTHWGLPLDPDWEWYVDEFSGEVIKSGASRSISHRKNEGGFLVSLLLTTDNPNLKIKVKLDDWTWATNMASLYTLGFYQIGQVGMNVLKYDTDNNIYTLYYIAKGWPGDPYRKESWIELVNDTSSNITITFFQLNRIILKPKWKKSD